MIECVGRPEVWEQALAMCRKAGTVNLFGGCPAGTTMNVDTAATTLVRGVKTVALQDIKTTTAVRVIRDGLEVMALSFQPLAVAKAVVRAANAELALLPRELQLVKGASVELVKSRSLRS